MNIAKERLAKYFLEARRHIEVITEAIEELTYPIKSYDELSKLQKFAVNSLIFRFSKLQDLVGSKIFRTYLEYNRYDTANKSFLELLKEIEKEGIIDIDSWDELRKLRNIIAHDYPGSEDEQIEAINLFIKKSSLLIDTVSRLESRYGETQ